MKQKEDLKKWRFNEIKFKKGIEKGDI